MSSLFGIDLNIADLRETVEVSLNPDHTVVLPLLPLRESHKASIIMERYDLVRSQFFIVMSMLEANHGTMAEQLDRVSNSPEEKNEELTNRKQSLEFTAQAVTELDGLIVRKYKITESLEKISAEMRNIIAPYAGQEIMDRLLVLEDAATIEVFCSMLYGKNRKQLEKEAAAVPHKPEGEDLQKKSP